MALTLCAEDGSEVTYTFTLTPGEIPVVNGDEAFLARYRTMASPYTSGWPEQLVRAMLDALKEPLPAGETRDRLEEEIRRSRIEEWERQRSDEASPD
ncbi:hypothetical protein [Kitasatospora cheerisanensis]|uniref:hypothetical protein n=1 Tax=Kitasatospora cheerisanensis TaxID=81942 RepID=UPI0012EDBEDA|nr:hypothetical protein [Kitasatospora cheerisanensis]